MIVAIDGPAGVGKSTITRCVAEKTGLLYVNSGNFYRAVTYFALMKNSKLPDEYTITEIAASLKFSLKNGSLYINNKNIENLLHTDRVDSCVAEVSSIVPVRKIVNNALHRTTKGLDLIVEGRDITTVVFPDSDVKIYLDASAETRAKRRWSQGVSSLTLDEIKKGIDRRDEIDKNKKEGKLKISSDAVYLDTSDLTIDEVCEKVIKIIENRNKKHPGDMRAL